MNMKLGLFVLLLFAILLLTIVFASGQLRFGLSGTPVYVVYVLCGALAAVLTFGLLGAWGEAQGTGWGVTVKLGGSIVALVVVTAGGGLYERYLHRTPEIDVRLNFYEDSPSVLTKITGQVRVFVGNQDISRDLKGDSTVLIQGVAADRLDGPISLDLDSSEWEIVEAPKTLSDAQPNLVKVRRRKVFPSPDQVDLTPILEKVEVMNFAPDPKKRSVILRVKLLNKSAKEVPLADSATLEILNRSAVPVRSASLRLGAGERRVARGSSEIIFDELLDTELVDFAMSSGWDVVVTLSFDKDVDETGGTYATQPTPFSRIAVDLSKGQE